MNKRLHRIVFNAARGLRMVVRESARSTGKGASGATSAAVSVAAVAAALMSAPLHAQIVADPGAPGRQRPTLLAAPNGVPLVNIQTPSAAGVSRNTYSQFDVNAKGVILNNSRTNAQTQLGGWVQGNPWLAGGGARVILNEVNSANPSQLRGYVEVAGQRAEVIIANPAGIQVNGGGFINASRATLTTGTPQFNANGGLDSFLVRGGTVNIEGTGLDASKTDYAAILARAVQLNAGVWANELKVVAGANQVAVDGSAQAPVAPTGPTPSFALDVAALGGMYAGKITLIGTEAGLGVRNAGHIGAGVGGMVVTAAGRLENIGTLEGAKVELKSASDIDNRGGTIRQAGTRELAITAPVLSNTAGGFIGAEPVAVQPEAGAGGASPTGGSASGGGSVMPTTGTATTPSTGTTVVAEAAPAQPAPATGPGAINAAGRLLNDGGRIYAGGEIGLDTPRIDNSGGSLSVGTLAVRGERFSNAGGTLNVVRGFSADVGTFDNSGGKLHAGSLRIASTGDLRNTDGTLTSEGDASLVAGGDMDNTRGALAAGQDLTLQAARMTNTGTVRSGRDAALTVSDALVNDGTLTAGRHAQLTVGSLQAGTGSVMGAGIRSDGHLADAGDLRVMASQTLSAHGTHLAAGGITLEGASVDLSQSKTNAANLAIAATQGDITTSHATLISAGTLGVRANVQGAQTLVNDGGMLNAGQLQIEASNIANTHGGAIVQTGRGATDIAVSGTLDNTSGRIASNGVDLDLRAATLANIGGKIEHAGSGVLRITVDTFDGADGGIVGNGALKMQAGQVDLDHSTLSATQIAIDADALRNRGGQLIQNGAGVLRATVKGVLDNTGGVMAAATGSGADVQVDAQSLVNQTGRISADGDLRVQSVSDIENTAGILRAGGSLSATAGGPLTNALGAIEAGGKTATLAVAADLIDNTDGRIVNVGTGDATLAATRVRNARPAGTEGQGLIAANGRLGLQAATLENAAGAVLSSSGALDLAVTGTLSNRGRIASGGALNFDRSEAALDNTHGEIAAAGAAHIAVRDIVNDAGRIATTDDSGADLSLAAQTLSNRGGTLASDRDLQLALPGAYTHEGLLHAGRHATLALGGRLDNTGTLEAVGTLRADAQSIGNAAGARIQAAAVDLHASGTLGNDGEITGGQVDIGADRVANTGAITGGKVTIAAREVANMGPQALIGATGDVSLWARDSVQNTGGATVYAGQDLFIGANDARNADGYLAHGVTAVVNTGSTMEARRHIDIAATALRNERPGVAFETVQSLDEQHTLSMPEWWHNADGNNFYYNPAASNYTPYEVYYVNPKDILESSTVFTPDGNKIERIVIRTHANDTAFFSARAGRGGAYGHRERITVGDGTRVLYALGRQDGAPNPDQVEGITRGVWQGEQEVRHWDGPPPAFSADYGNCSTDCVRFYTQPRYADPNTTMIRDTQVARGPSTALSEVRRDAHTTATDDLMVEGAGAVGRIVAGGDIRVGFTVSVTNSYGDIMAGHELKLQGAPGSTVDNMATSLYRRYAFDVVRHYADGVTQRYVAPEQSQKIGSVSGVLSGVQGVHIVGGQIRNVDTAAGTAANITENVRLSSGGVANTGGASNAGGASGPDRAGVVGGVAAGGATKPPAGGLFTVRPDPTSHYLYETRAEFANYRQWASSDYLFNALGLNPDNLQKRLGDGFFEQRLVREQIAELTGRRYLKGYADDDAQYIALLTAGAIFAQQYGLRPGIALTPEQMKALTSDIVWLETQTVALPDGSTRQVLVPKVYLAQLGANALKPDGALITGDNVHIEGDNIVNRGGTIGGKGTQRAVLVASADIVNQGGTLQAGQLGLRAGGDIRNETLTVTKDWGQSDGRVQATGRHTSLSNVARIEAGDKLQIRAGGDFVDTAGRIKSAGTASIKADGDVKFNTLDTGNSYQASVGASSMRRESTRAQVGTLSTGGDLLVSGGRDVTLNGTQVEAGGNATLNAGRHLGIEAVSSSQASDQRNDPAGSSYRQSRSETTVQGATVKAGGDLVAKAGTTEQGDLTVRGSQLEAKGTALLQSSRDIVVADARETSSYDDYTHRSSSGLLSKKSSVDHQTGSRDIAVGSSIGGKNVMLSAGNDVVVAGSQVAAQVQLVLSGGRDVRIQSTEDHSSQSSYHAESKSGFSASALSGISYGQSASTQSQTGRSTTPVGSTLSGGNVSIDAGRDAQIIASAVVADKNVAITAGRNIDVLTATDTQSSTTASQSSSTSVGLVSGIAPRQTLYGTAKGADNGSGESRTAVTSLISANDGKLTMVAGLDPKYKGTGQGNITTEGADLLAKDKVTLSGNAVNLKAATSSGDSSYHAESRSVTLGSQLTGAVGGQVTRIYDMAQASKHTADSRLKGALELKAGYDAYKLATSGALGAGIADAGAPGTQGDPAGAAFGVSVSISSSKSRQDSTERYTTQRGTNIQAGAIDITARETDINMQGAKLQARDIALDAERNINLGAAENTAETHSSNAGSSLGAGVTAGFGSQNGISFQLSAGRSKGKANGSETHYDNTQVTAADTLSIRSGGDTNLRGAQLTADRVKADIGGNLNIESLQDRTDYRSQQSSGGIDVSICVPPICYGQTVTANVNYAKQAVDHNYQSATGQSGIAAGAGGFDITVKGNTDLKGGAITSTAPIDKNSFTTGSLTTSDLVNRQNTHASSESMSLSYGSATSVASDLARSATNTALGNLNSGKGLPGDKNETSQTQSVISPAHVKITGTGNAEVDARSAENVAVLTARDATTANGALMNNLTLQQAQDIPRKQQEAQAHQQAAQLVGSVITNVIGDVSAKAGWKEGSAEKIALHGLAGIVQAKLGDGSVAAGATVGMLNEALLPMMEDYLKGQGISRYNPDGSPNVEFNELLTAGSTLLGAAVGAASGNAGMGAVVANNATVNNYLKHADVDRLAKRIQDCGNDQGCKDKAMDEAYRVSTLNDIELLNCKSSNNCDALKAEYREGYRAIEDLMGAGMKPEDVGRILNLESNAQAIIRNGLDQRQCTTQACQDNADYLMGIGKGLSKITPAALVSGTGVAAYELTTALMNTGLTDTAVAVLQGIKGLPESLLVHLNSDDPKVRGEALVDALAIGGVATAVVAKMGQAGAGALVRRAVAKAEAAADAQVIASRMREVAIHVDDARFSEVAQKIVEAEKAGWKTAEGKTWWPPENGKVPGTDQIVQLKIGQRLDRYGGTSDKSTFLAPADTPLGKRALPDSTNLSVHDEYIVLKPFRVEESRSMPWFGQEGMGLQYETSRGSEKTIAKLVEDGFLRKVVK
ncbi:MULTISPECIES: hemagglutinin repeat-containing protein [unclassified Variovorax]|uniref:hemagglutinin repeat-containing protein n=1 Tax=unclassified Variovorax TaxID=663243 RepID=UPI002577411E|nr:MULTISPECIES: hemagglutinin repeat-containing protein [unclassified Variovorax]MDM0087151.1 hemagglutinin repeat-containing protein [Variovorax sp. J22G40]MDM0144592.1 hemagglutinin repeat-containing protein [Variovorax sp. J2P1-31]